MTFQGAQASRIFQAVALILGVGMVALLIIYFAAMGVWLLNAMAGIDNANRVYEIDSGTRLTVFRVAVGDDGETWFYAATDDADWRFGWIPATQVTGYADCPAPDSPSPAGSPDSNCSVTGRDSGSVDILAGPEAGLRVVGELTPGASKQALLRADTGYLYVYTGWVKASAVALSDEGACAALPVISAADSSAAQVCSIQAARTPSDLRLSPNPVATQKEQQDWLQEKTADLLTDVAEDTSTLNTLMIVHASLMALVTFVVARWTARRNATGPEQGVGYGVAIGFGVMLLYGVCLCNSTVYLPTRLIFWFLMMGAAVLGGQMGGQKPRKAKSMPGSATGAMPPGYLMADPDRHYNLGVAAAMGGRREEAREHFKRALQMQPRNVRTWLQLANLADTPEQAWNYIQQARSIDPNDPAVRQAVDIIWPQIQEKLERSAPPTAQPPYPGGAQDEPQIPRGMLPEVRPPGEIKPPGDDTDADAP